MREIVSSCGWFVIAASVIMMMYGWALAKKVPRGPDPFRHKRIRVVFSTLCGAMIICGVVLQYYRDEVDSHFAARTFRVWKGASAVDLKGSTVIVEGIAVPFRLHELTQGELGFVATTAPVLGDQVVVDCVTVFNTDEYGKNRIIVGVPDIAKLGGAFTTKLTGGN